MTVRAIMLDSALFPAYAGVILSAGPHTLPVPPFPRIRGGDPYGADLMVALYGLFPAYAGVILLHHFSPVWRLAFPRIRGGDPFVSAEGTAVVDFSPHTRG